MQLDPSSEEQVFHERQQVPGAPREAIELRDHNRLYVAGLARVHDAGQAGPAEVLAAQSFVGNDIDKFEVRAETPYKESKGDRKSFWRTVRVGTPIDRIHLTVSNPNGSCEQSALATVTGIQDGKQVYRKTRQVYDFNDGSGQSRFTFPDYTPIKKGTIEWTVEILDDDPDRDESRESTRVR